jgi:DNA-directed RNA polymerase specialized sigma24 family protein
MKIESAIRAGPACPVRAFFDDPQNIDDAVIAIRAMVGKRRGSVAAARAEWEEVWQETCTRALRKAAHYDPSKGVVIAWLQGIASYVIRELLRGRIRSGSIPEGFDEPSPPFDVSIQPIAAELIARLPNAERTLLLWQAEGCSCKEIGARLNITAGAAAARLHRAMKVAREMLASFADGRDGRD